MNLKLSIIDKQVISHIRMNGSMTDEVGKELAFKFVLAALNVAEIRDAAREYKFALEDLSLIYITMIESLRPNPTINANGPMLVASLIFIEKTRIISLMNSVHALLPSGITVQERNRIIIECSEIGAQDIWNFQKADRGESPFVIFPLGTGRATSGGGCLVLIGAIIIIPVCYQVARIFCG